MAEVCRNPFDGDSHYDINVEQEVDVQIYLGSLALYLDEQPYAYILTETSKDLEINHLNNNKDSLV